MQTFLPYNDFVKSSQCLDFRRLGKQRVEAKQIINILTGVTPDSRWKNHPAVLMWKGYVPVLKFYHDVMLYEWIRRGYKNSMPFLFQSYEGMHHTISCDKIIYTHTFKEIHLWGKIFEISLPDWLTDEFCSWHRAALLEKNYDYYKQFNWTEEPKIDYLWGNNNEQSD